MWRWKVAVRVHGHHVQLGKSDRCSDMMDDVENRRYRQDHKVVKYENSDTDTDANANNKRET